MVIGNLLTFKESVSVTENSSQRIFKNKQYVDSFVSESVVMTVCGLNLH
jgi:hypothetical protein